MSQLASILGNVGGLLNNQANGSSTIIYKGSLVVRKTNVLALTNVVADLVDDNYEVLGQAVTLELISSTAIDPSTKTGKTTKSASIENNWILSKDLLAVDDFKYSIKFSVDKDFGVPAAFTIKNPHPNEFYLKSLTLELPGGNTVEFHCNSWVYNASRYKSDRIFFSNELYLPNDTPAGLVQGRQNELKNLRGDGTGAREDWERIYDYDTYNDLGSKRSVLGGSKEYPYPRRCRTGRTLVNGDETPPALPMQKFYIPSDESFSSTKNSDFLADSLKAGTLSLLPALESILTFDQTFDSFNDVKALYDQGIDLSKTSNAPIQGTKRPFELINEQSSDKSNDNGNSSFLKFPVPQVFEANEKGWRTDEEFARQMLSGANPMVIECLKEFPPTSSLDPATYGSQTSAITEEHISRLLEGVTVQEALKQQKLFILNYYDAYMPYLNKINALEETYAYASRTLLYLKSDGTLKPVTIELSTPTSQRVFVPPTAGETDWLWELAKAHVTTNDSGYHQLVNHWLRTHACVEPFIIATNRQLSALHPLNAFLKPHFKNTMSINAQARQALINANGIIEKCFSTGEYSMEMSAVVYKSWRFDEQGLPADLIKRGMAIPDAASKHGVKLTIEDYPYAADGLEIWACLEKWTKAYIDACYKDDAAVISDTELQAWWTEIINVGHADKKDETWWGKLDKTQNLAQVLTTLIWVASAHHAAVNFGQYAYAGYMPNHPTATHKAIPEKDSEEYKQLLKDPEGFFLSAVSRKLEGIIVMATIEILSTHASDEEYLGQRAIKNWTNNGQPQAAFSEFSNKLTEVEELIRSRNKDAKLKNRSGPVNVPYTLLYPSSESGITGKGIPNSISI